MEIRPYCPDDLDAVVACFNRSVRTIGARFYTPKQIEAWAPVSPDLAAWSHHLDTGGIFLAKCNNELAGFVRVEKTGMVDLLFVNPQFERRGIGKALIDKACTWARKSGASKIFSDVSLAARPLFEAMGFQVVEEQTVERGGVLFQNYRMILKDSS